MKNHQEAGNQNEKGERIAKRIARAGICSRRAAEVLIAQGKVKVNGARITTPAFNVQPGDAVEVSGKILEEKEQTRLWLYHKPDGLVTTHKDPQGRPTVFDALPKTLPRVISVGRLDLNSEGLLLLTNDGELARKLELPSTGWIRRYRARVFGNITPNMLAEMKKGIKAQGVQYGSVEVSLPPLRGEDRRGGDTGSISPGSPPTPTLPLKGGGSNTWLTVSLKEGKNREVRKIFEHFGCRVNRLIRLSYGPFQLGSLPKGEVKEVSGKVLKSFLGK